MKIKGKLTSVGLARIDIRDFHYRITSGQTPAILAEGLAQIGLLHPPVLISRSSSVYSIVSGFRRIHAARRLNWAEIEARVLAPDTDPLFVSALAVADNAQHRTLNPIEQARAVRLLSPFFDSPLRLSRFAGNLGLSLNPQLIRRLKRIANLPPLVQKHMEAGVVPLSIALDLESLDGGAAEAFSRLFDAIRPTLSQQKEMLALALDIAGREGQSPEALLGERDFAEIRVNENISRQEKIKAVRAFLKKRRYPRIHQFEMEAAARKRALSLPAGVGLEFSENFESAGCTLRLTFTCMEALRSQIKGLQQLAEDPNLAALAEKRIED